MPERLGGHLVAESLAALGARAVFGVPGVHALAIWEGLRTTELAMYGARTELGAAFAADGHARASGLPAPLIVSTGPGALNALPGLMEAASSHVPMLAVSSQIPSDLIGRDRGYLHELPDQMASFAPLVKYAARAQSVESIPGLLARAWRAALTPPAGPTYVELPVDLLRAPAGTGEVSSLQAVVERECAPLGQLAGAAAALAHARGPVIWAGGGVIRSGATRELRELAELLGAPVATTYMGKGAIPDEHPLAAGCACEEPALQELLSDADVLLCAGTELGEQTTAEYRLSLPRRMIHLDAAPERVGITYPAMPLIGDAKLSLRALVAELSPRPDGPSDAGEARAAAVRARVRRSVESRAGGHEPELLATIERVLPEDAITAWDMTILGSWAAPYLRLGARQQFLYPLGSGTLGYAWPAAIGAAVAHPGRTALAVVGDGGIQYAIGELATAAQHEIASKLLLIDDGGYGVLREYQLEMFGHTTAVELPGADLAALVSALAVPVRTTTPGELADALTWALEQPGPAAVLLRAELASPRTLRPGPRGA